MALTTEAMGKKELSEAGAPEGYEFVHDEAGRMSLKKIRKAEKSEEPKAVKKVKKVKKVAKEE